MSENLNEQVNLGVNLGQNGGIPQVNTTNMSSTYIPPVNNWNGPVTNVTNSIPQVNVVSPVMDNRYTVAPVNESITVNPSQVSTTDTFIQQSQTIPAQTIPAQQFEATNIPVTNTTVQGVNEKTLEPIVKDDFRITTSVLRDIVTKARKVGKWDPMVVQSQVINLTLNEKGITVCTTNGNIDYEHTDSNYSFTKSITVCVDNKVLGEVLSSITIPEIELLFDNNTKVLTIQSPENAEEQFSYPMAQRIDISTQQPIELALSLPLAYDSMIPFDYNKICNIISQSKPVRAFVSGRADFDGILFSNLIISSDASIMLMEENDKNIQDKTFFVSSEFCEYIASMPFNASKTRIGFAIDNNGNVYAINISDGCTSLCGVVAVTSGIPKDVCQHFWETFFETKITVDTKRMCNSLKRIIPFIDKVADDDCASFVIKGNNLKITPYSRVAHDTMIIDNPSQLDIEINLSIVRMVKLLQSIKSDKFNITFNPENRNCICLEYDNYKCIVALAN